MAGLTIREFTISTKVTNSRDSSVPNQQKTSNKDADQGTSKGTYNQTATKHKAPTSRKSLFKHV